MKKINLLPKSKQSELAHERAFYSVAVAATIAALIMVVGVVVQIGVGIYLDRSTLAINSQIEQLKSVADKTENTEVKNKIRVMNAQMDDFNALLQSTPQWSTVLEAFVSNVPAGVRITEFDANSTDLQVNISGYSPTRDQVIDLYNNINADKTHFKNINYPLENVTQPINVRFNFTFTVADGILTEVTP